MKKTISLIIALLLLVSFCACSGGETQTPAATAGQPEAAPEATPEAAPETTPEAAPEAAPETTPEAAPEATPEAAPETTPEAAPETTPEAAPEATPAPAPEQSAGGNIREESVTDKGTSIVMEYSAETGELLKVEFYSAEGNLETIQFMEHDMLQMEAWYRADGSIESETYFLESGDVSEVVIYNYDDAGNFIDTVTLDAYGNVVGGEGSGSVSIFDVERIELENGGYELREYDPDGMLIYSSIYDASGWLLYTCDYRNGMAYIESTYENGVCVSYTEYIFEGDLTVGIRFYTADGNGSFELVDETYFDTGAGNEPVGGESGASGNYTERIDYQDGGYDIYEYNADGWLVSEKWYDPDGQLTYHLEAENGLTIRESNYENGVCVGYSEHEYIGGVIYKSYNYILNDSGSYDVSEYYWE